MLYKNIDSKNGFTLIEIIASITLLSILLIIFIPVFPKIMKGSINTEHEMVAGNLLSSVVDDIQTEHQAKTTKFAKYINTPTNSKSCNTPKKAPQNVLPKEGNYQVDDETFTTKLTLCQEEREKELDIVRVHIEILSVDKKVLTNYYTYFIIVGDCNR